MSINYDVCSESPSALVVSICKGTKIVSYGERVAPSYLDKSCHAMMRLTRREG
ncbi:MAG: hypothetical protein JNG44_01055 [Porphyromonas sp.]|uniref:hypothetical protein n=1 Tax=Porphyromonas sp. TaxID=1924944 RepID=UPI001A63C3B0|nr:hypothetical protein [Porphyromonas sp.]MBL6452278.1 hypothetical protein [Porphyromonas sp.]